MGDELKKIKVIADAPTDFSLLTQVERETLIRSMIAEYPDLPESIFEAFVKMELCAIRDRISAKCETMIELILRQILETNMVLPILPTLTMTSAQKRALAAANETKNATTDTKNTPAEVRPTQAESLGGITVRVSRSIPCFRGNIESIAAPNEDLPLIALKILPWDQPHEDIPAKPIYTELRSDRAGIVRSIDINAACELFQYIRSHVDAMRGLPRMPAMSILPRERYSFEWKEPSAPSELLLRLDCRDIHDVFIRNLEVIWFKMNAGDLSAIEPYEQQREFRRFMAGLASAQNASAELRSSLLNIIREKLGPREYNRILRSYLPGDKILSLLNASSANIIKAEYARRNARALAIANNTCPHVKAILEFERTNDNYSFRRLTEFMPVTPIIRGDDDLPVDETTENTTDETTRKNVKNAKTAKNVKNTTGKITDKAANSAMIQCVRCQFDMICPHTVESMELRNRPQNEIAAAMQKYIVTSALTDNYYCKICGAAIFSTDMFTDLKQTIPMENEELKNMQWGEIASIIRYLKFTTIINTTHFIALVRDSTYKYIAELEKQILKSKTTTADEIKAKKRLYATIYGYAYIIMIIMSGKYGVGFRDLTPRGNPLLEYLKYAIELIISTKNVIIKTITGFSNDLIKNQLISAYKAVTTGETILDDTGVGDLEPTRVTVRYDPVYWYIYDFTIRDEMLNGKKLMSYYVGMIKRMPDILRLDVDTVDAGRGKTRGGTKNKPADEILSVYERVKLADLRSWHLSSLDKITSVSSQGEWSRAMQGFIAASYQYFLHGLQEPNTLDFTGPPEKFSKLMGVQTMLDLWRQKYHAKGFSSVRRDVVHRLPEYWVSPVDINRLFDESGRKHVWNILIVTADSPADNSREKLKGKSSEGKLSEGKLSGEHLREMSIGDITSVIESGHKFAGKVIDRKCSICGIRKSAVGTISSEKIRARLAEITFTQNFFRWFENRCPEGGHHTWVNNSCEACSINLQMFAQPFGEAAQGYLARYREKFAAVGADPLILPRSDESEPVSTFTEEYANYAFDFNTVLTLASKLKINHKLIMALGAFEKTSLGDIEGTFIPPEITFRDHPRVYILASHIKNMFTWYNLFRGYARIVRPPAEITAVITELGLTYSTIGIMDKLPAIYNDYNARQDHFYHSKKPRNIIEFQLQSLCEKLLLILDGPEVKLRKTIVDFIMKKILHSETLLTIPGDFNWSIVYPDSKIVTSDENYEAEAEERADEDEDEASPFSMDAFDMEDADPDDEDVSNQVRAGENLGMD